VTNGLVGLYYPSSYSAASNRWSDLSGKGNHAITTGTISKAVATSLNGKEYLFGGTWEAVKWPQVRCQHWPHAHSICCCRISAHSSTILYHCVLASSLSNEN
jgi:hypothetical protein